MRRGREREKRHSAQRETLFCSATKVYFKHAHIYEYIVVAYNTWYTTYTTLSFYRYVHTLVQNSANSLAAMLLIG